MSLQIRISSLITAVGADIKELKARKPTILEGVNAVSNTQEPGNAVEWQSLGPGGALLAKLVGINPIVASVVVNRSELWARARSRDGTLTADRLILDSDGKSFLFVPIVTALPTTGPSGGALMDGQECQYLADATNGVVWHLKYKTSTTKWHFIGGGSLAAADVVTDQSTSSTGYTALGTAGPSVTLPLAGDYDISFGSNSYLTGTAGNLYHSFDVGGTAASDNDAVIYNGANISVTGSKTVRKTGVAAAAAIVSKYRVANAATGGHWMNRWLRAVPIRVS